MAKFKTETDHPFKELIDTLEGIVDENFRTDEPKGQEFLAKITGLIRAACYLTHAVVESYPPDQLNARFVKEQIPYKVVYKLCTKSEDGGYTAVEGSEYFVFTIKPCEENVNMFIASDELQRYLKAMSEEPMIYAHQITKELKAITRLYNIIYGPFYVNEPHRIYGVDEVNVLLMHRRIPFHLKQEMVVGPISMPMPAYSTKECRW